MTEPSGNPEYPDARYPHVGREALRIIATYGNQFNNTGGNEPAELLERLATDRGISESNRLVFTMATMVWSQVTLIKALESAGVIAR